MKNIGRETILKADPRKKENMRDRGCIVPEMDVKKISCEVGWWTQITQDRVQYHVFSISGVIIPKRHSFTWELLQRSNIHRSVCCSHS